VGARRYVLRAIESFDAEVQMTFFGRQVTLVFQRVAISKDGDAHRSKFTRTGFDRLKPAANHAV